MYGMATCVAVGLHAPMYVRCRKAHSHCVQRRILLARTWAYGDVIYCNMPHKLSSCAACCIRRCTTMQCVQRQLVYRCQYNMAPQYLATQLNRASSVASRRRLCSASMPELIIPHLSYLTLDNRRLCVLRDRSSGMEYLDTVRAVL